MTFEEMFTKFWFAYPSDLCNNKRGGKQPAKQSFKKLKVDEVELKRMILNMNAQATNDRKDPDSYRWPFVSTYLNQRRFDDTIDTIEKAPARELDICQNRDCKEPVHGQLFKHCALHLPRDPQDPILLKLRQKYKDLGLIKGKDESKQEHLDRCKQVYKDSLGGIFA